MLCYVMLCYGAHVMLCDVMLHHLKHSMLWVAVYHSLFYNCSLFATLCDVVFVMLMFILRNPGPIIFSCSLCMCVLSML